VKPILFLPKPSSRRALGVGHLCPRELWEGNVEGGLLYWGPQRMG